MKTAVKIGGILIFAVFFLVLQAWAEPVEIQDPAQAIQEPVDEVVAVVVEAPAKITGPAQAIQDPMNDVVAILADPAYQGDDPALKDEQRKALRKAIDGVFDFTEISKRALARNWRILNLEERRKFRDLFAELLGNTYLSKIQDSYSGEQVVITGVNQVTDEMAVVSTGIRLEKGQMLPIDYSVYLAGGAWKIYDVNVEGVSLVKNYRSQFNDIMMRGNAQDLINRLESTVERQRAGEKDSL
ncbi:MAG: ABC transporter substrate-binding protein [Desulfatibacillaceae bacterium]|nr:ABC transporter substrate-binding protein [Desulfatibacillaceae bacterium]